MVAMDPFLAVLRAITVCDWGRLLDVLAAGEFFLHKLAAVCMKMVRFAQVWRIGGHRIPPLFGAQAVPNFVALLLGFALYGCMKAARLKYVDAPILAGMQ